MTYRLEPHATRRVGRRLVADADDLDDATRRVPTPDTGYREPQVADVIDRLVGAGAALAQRARSNGEALQLVTEQMLVVDDWIGMGLRWE